MRTSWTTVWLALFTTLFTTLFAASCDDHYDLPDSGGNGNNHPVYYGFESEPTLSLDHQWVYYTVTDTVTAANSGIYRARANTAIREQVLRVTGARTPSVLPDNKTLVFVHNGQLKRCRIDSGQIQPIGAISAAYSAAASSQIVVIDDGGILYRVAMAGDKSSFGTGQFPRGVSADTIVYLALANGGKNSVWRAKVSTVEPTKIADLPGGMAPQWPSVRPSSPEIVFTAPSSNLYRVLRFNSTTQKTDTLGMSRSARTCMLDNGSVLFTGDDGRLWIIGPFGGTPSPWIDVE